MGQLICVCAEASMATCHRCPKGIVLEPDQVYAIPRWPRKAEKYRDLKRKITKE